MADEITPFSEALCAFLDKLEPAIAMTVLDCGVGYVIAKHGLPAERVIQKHSENIPDFIELFAEAFERAGAEIAAGLDKTVGTA